MKKNLITIMAFQLAMLMTMPLSNAQGRKKADQPTGTPDPLADVSLGTFRFRSIGPALTSGRIADIAVNPANHSEFYVAAAAGGVWKTTNAGVTFDPVFENEGSYSIGCVTIDPANSNVIWVGTGENNNQRSVSYGDGVYKSIDGGKSWTNMGLKNSEHIGMIKVDPRNSDVVYVAAYGPLWSPGGDRGLYKTTDGGKTWENILSISENTGVNEIHLDPRNPDVLYATAHQRRRRQWTYLGGGPESGIYKSTDAGKSWEKINRGLPGGDKGRIGMAISPVNPEIIYATVEAGNRQGGFYRSTDRGASWEKRSSTVSSGNYYQEVVADPVEENRVYLLDTYTMVSNDGGKTFAVRGEKSKHYDDHTLWIDPDNNNHVMEGSDGGVYESFDNENWRMFTNLPVTQFYKVSVDNAFPFYNIMGGTQDNYSLVGPSQTLSEHGIVSSDWIVTVTGDGFESVPDPEDPNIVYAQSQNGGIMRIDKKSGEGVDIQPKPRKGEKEYNFNWDAPVMVSPHNHMTIYFGGNKLFKSTDRGDSWEVISGELDQDIDRNLLPVMGKVWPMDAVAKNGSTSRYGACVSLDESRLVEGLIYAGTDDGQINITEDGGKTWRKINSFPGVPKNTYVYDLIADKHDSNVVYAAFNNHKSGDFRPYVYKSSDRGRTWVNISGNLPEGAVYALEQDHVKASILFAGTEYGVFVTLDGGGHWTKLRAGLPTINVRDLAIQERENDLVAASFGRGFYILDNYAPLREISSATMANDGYLFKIKDAYMFNTWRPLGGLGSVEKGFQGEDYFSAPNPDRGVEFTYWMKDTPSSLRDERMKKEKEEFRKGDPIPYPTLEEYKAENTEPVSYLIFTIADQEGNFIRELRSPVRKGINKITWDMKYPAASSVSDLQATLTSGLPSSDVFVLPGKYQVKLSANIKGTITDLAGPVDFELRELDNRTIPAADRAEMTAFKLKAVELDNAVRAVTQSLGELRTRLPLFRAATKGLQANVAVEVNKDIDKLEAGLTEADISLNGDRDYRTLDLDGTYSLRSRAGAAIRDISGSTSNIPGTSKMNYDIAASEFEPLLEKVRSLVTEFDNMESKLKQMGAPLLPGELPDFSKK